MSQNFSEKSARFGVQDTADLTAQRQLSPREEEALEKGKSQWVPRIFQSYGTPIPELMASPARTGLLFGLPIGLVGAGVGSALGGKGHASTGALIGGLGAGGLAALAAGWDRHAKNEGLEELMRRMPEGASKRDLLADPQYQSDFLGWDNAKIVATARARYYRPTERFTKQVYDRFDDNGRYNQSYKSSSINKDVSMSQSEKQALSLQQKILLNHLIGSGALGSLIGGAGGAITSKNKLRGMARGMLMGAGTGLGIGAGAPVGGVMGHAMDKNFTGGNLFGTMGAGTGGTLGGIAGYEGGKALADKLVGPSEDDEKEENKKAAQAILDNKTMTLAEKFAAYAALLNKQAESPTMAASIPAMGGLTTSAPAGFNPSNMQIPNSPTTGVAMNSPDVPGNNIPPAVARAAAAPVPAQDSPSLRAAVSELTGKPLDVDSAGALINAKFREENAKRLADAKERALNAKVFREYQSKNWDTAKRMGGDFLSFVKRKGQDAVTGGIGAGKALGNWLHPEVKTPDPTMWDKVRPYAPYAAIGAGGLGALALADYMSRRKKKTKRPQREEEEGDYSMPKAAHVNWYALTKSANNPMEKQAISTYLRMMARLARAGRNVGDMASRAAPYVNPMDARSVPFYVGEMSGATGGFGLQALGKHLMSGKPAPSMLQQIMQSKYTPYAAAGLGAAGLLGGAAYMGSRAGKTEAKKKKPVVEKQSNITNIGLGAGGGAALGGGLGALAGALAPGHETDPNSGRRRRRSRLMGALRGLAAGGAVGGIGGGVAGHFGGDKLREALMAHFASKGQDGGPVLPKGISTDVTMQSDPIEAAKAQAAANPAPAPATPVIPQGPTSANATMGGSVPPMPGVQNAMPPQSPAPPAGIPNAPVAQQGPTSFNATMGGAPMMQPKMM